MSFPFTNGHLMLMVIVGIATGWSFGHPSSRVGYAMWLLWSGESSFFPSQHDGKMMWASTVEPGWPEQLTGMFDLTPESSEHPQKTMLVSCGPGALLSPAIIRRFLGTVFTWLGEVPFGTR